MCNVSIIIENLTIKRYRPHRRKFEKLHKVLGYAVNVCELTKKYHIEWIVFMPSDGCVYPGNNAVPIFINVLTETSRFDRKFYFSEKFLDIKLESIEREVEKKTIESRQ